MISVADLFDRAGVEYLGVVRWRDDVPLDGPGVYVVSTNMDPMALEGRASCPLDQSALAGLLETRPEMTIDGGAADMGTLSTRLQAMWVAGAPVAYIGLASRSVRRRISQFYATRIGARAPHAGGWPIKMIDESSGVWVHYGATSEVARAESTMIQNFVDSVPREVRVSLIDPTAPLPFANLELPGGRRKRHGIRGAKAKRVAPQRSRILALDEPRDIPIRSGEVSYLTQNVTAADIRVGQVRVPAVSKALFPSSPSRIEIEVGGEILGAGWNPRRDVDRERSGVIRFGQGKLPVSVTQGGPRTIRLVDGRVRLD